MHVDATSRYWPGSFHKAEFKLMPYSHNPTYRGLATHATGALRGDGSLSRKIN